MPNLQLFCLTVFQNVICIKSKLPYLKTTLIFHRTSNIIEEFPQDYQEQGQIRGDKRVSYILGIFKTFNKSFLVLVDECTLVAKIQKQEIYHIDQIAYIQIEDFNPNTNKDILDSLSNQKKLLQQGFYFSINGDITLARHFQKLENSFVWNHKLLQNFRENKISIDWQLPMIQGFVEQIESYIDKQKISIALISRRSRFMGGTRYYSRGVNDDGHVANFIETEQLLTYGNILISFVVIRGSVPLFWCQDGSYSIKLTRSTELTKVAFIKHFELLRRYGKIYCVNLMQNSKQVEQLLSDNFQLQFQDAKLEHVMYQHIDFHSLVKNGKSNNLNSFIYKYENILDQFQFYVEQDGKMITKQDGSFRINCLDCLDRTNLFQSKLCLYSLDRSLKILKLKLSSNPDILNQFDESNKKLIHDLIIKYKHMWANNGDMLSFLYAGTNSSISELAREGKRGFMGMIKDGYRDLERFYARQFEDDNKQLTITHLLRGQMQLTHFDEWVQGQEKRYCQMKQVSILVSTWNVGGNNPITKDLTKSIFNIEQNQNPDIIVFGLQEMVDLNPQNIVIMSNEKQIILWNELLINNLSLLGQYSKISEADLVGLYICVYVKKQEIHRITQIDYDIIKTGLGGTLGNKGGVSIKFKFDDSLIGFTCVHLSSGGKQFQERLNEIDEIHQKTFSNSKYQGNLQNMDYSFFFGDMNFRIDLTYQETVEKIRTYNNYLNQDQNNLQAKSILAYLLNQDQLNKFKNKNTYLQNYQEGTITFLPTYKFDKQSYIYDTSKKQRTPSWCDRILLNTKDELIAQQRYYKSSELLDSDHRPVSSYYIIETKQIDKDKLEQIKNEYCLPNQNQSKSLQPKMEPLNRINQQVQFTQQIPSKAESSENQSVIQSENIPQSQQQQQQQQQWYWDNSTTQIQQKQQQQQQEIDLINMDSRQHQNISNYKNNPFVQELNENKQQTYNAQQPDLL